MINGRRKQAGGFLWNYTFNYDHSQLKDLRDKKTTYFNSTPHIKSDEEIEASNNWWRKTVAEYEKDPEHTIAKLRKSISYLYL